MLRKGLDLILLASFVGLVLIARNLTLDNNALSHDVSLLKEARGLEFRQNGISMDSLADWGLEPAMGDESPVFSGSVRLLLVGQPGREYTDRIVPYWAKLLRSLARPDIEVWLVTKDGPDLSQPLTWELPRTGREFIWLRMSDPVRFSLRSGIVDTPATAVLDRDGAFRVFYYGEIGDPEVEFIRNWLSARNQLDSSKPFRKSSQFAGTTRISP